jgi:hypothetical protein
VLPLLALVIVVGGAAVVLLGRIGGAAVDRARASAAADAAALAGAADGRQSAEGLARANGGRLRDYVELGSDRRVRVTVGDAEARARARRSGGGLVVPPGREGAAPAMLAALARADQVLGRRVVVTTVHRGGLEVTVAAAWASSLAGAGGQTGLCPSAPADPLRFAVCS